MDEKIFDQVQMKHSLALHEKEEAIKQALIQKINKIPNNHLLKHDPEIILWCCNILEEAYQVYIDGKKPDKKNIVTTIFTLVFNLTKPEQEAVEKTIQFLWNNKRIKRVKLHKKVLNTVWDWACRRIL